MNKAADGTFRNLGIYSSVEASSSALSRVYLWDHLKLAVGFLTLYQMNGILKASTDYGNFHQLCIP